MRQGRPVRGIRAAALACAMLACAVLASGAGGGAAARAQELIGSVKASDADVTGASDVMDGRAVLAGSVGVTARDHTAPISLGRGGTVQVCQTSALHLTEGKETEGKAQGGSPPLLFSLDRGAIEIEMNGTANDTVMTPDLRMTVREAGPLDLRMRVARNGDTCVENRGASAPTLAVSDPFGESNYELMAGQHVLFEHGSVHEVVDHETSPCGCPDPRGANMAEALMAASDTNSGAKTAVAPTVHPFPAAISEGLAPPAEAPPPAIGAAPPVPVTDTLSYNGNPSANDGAGDTSEAAARAKASASAQAAAEAEVASWGRGPMIASSAPGQASATAAIAAIAPIAAKGKKAKGAKTSAVASGGSGTVGATPALVARNGAAPFPEQASASNGGAHPSSASAARESEPTKRADPNPNRDLVHMIGHFFHAIFGH